MEKLTVTINPTLTIYDKPGQFIKIAVFVPKGLSEMEERLEIINRLIVEIEREDEEGNDSNTVG
jgi:hypothetical protein